MARECTSMATMSRSCTTVMRHTAIIVSLNDGSVVPFDQMPRLGLSLCDRDGKCAMSGATMLVVRVLGPSHILARP
jgi:hypothetical protein